jgi:DNA-binding transcriptional LysR family regulator
MPWTSWIRCVNSMGMFTKVAELNSFARAAESLDLAHHPYIAFRTEHCNDDVTFQDSEGAEIAVHPNPDLIANNIGTVRESALDGMGMVTLSAYLIDDDIRSGRLERLTPQYRLADREFRIVYSNRKFRSLNFFRLISFA